MPRIRATNASPTPVWKMNRKASTTWSEGVPGFAAQLVSPDDPDLDEIIASIESARAVGLDVCDPELLDYLVRSARERIAARGHAPAEVAKPNRAASAPGTRSVVYYMRVGDRVKIGYTRNLLKRVETLGPEELLATEPGGRDIERQRHSQFMHLHTHREWFRYVDDLVSHVERLRIVGNADPVLPENTHRAGVGSQYVDGHLVTATVAARLTGVTVARICTWVTRGKLAVAGRNEQGRPLYLVVDVMRVKQSMHRPRAA